MALLKKRLEEAKATAAAAASSKAVKEEAKEDIKAIRASCSRRRSARSRASTPTRTRRRRRRRTTPASRQTRPSARWNACARNSRRRRPRFAPSPSASRRRAPRRCKSASARAEQRTKLEEELAARESERHKQVLKLKEVLKEHADAKKRIAEEDAPEEGEVDLNPASARATPASGARGGSLAAHIASADNSRDGPSPSPHYRADGPAPSPHYRQDSNQGLDRWGSGTPGAGPGGWGTPGVDAGGPYGHRPRMGMGMGMGMGMSGEIRAGDWMCPKGCGNVFASKMRCFPMWHSETGGTAGETPHGRLGSLTRRGAMRRDETRMAFEASRTVIFISVEGVRAFHLDPRLLEKFARLRYAPSTPPPRPAPPPLRTRRRHRGYLSRVVRRRARAGAVRPPRLRRRAPRTPTSCPPWVSPPPPPPGLACFSTRLFPRWRSYSPS